MDSLKPCPFCGGEAVKEFDSDWGLVVRCLECPAIMSESPCLGILKPVEAWNTRAERTCHMDCVKDGPICTVWKFDCCGFEFVENDCAAYQTELPGTWCPNCGAKVIANEMRKNG